MVIDRENPQKCVFDLSVSIEWCGSTLHTLITSWIIVVKSYKLLAGFRVTEVIFPTTNLSCLYT